MQDVTGVRCSPVPVIQLVSSKKDYPAETLLLQSKLYQVLSIMFTLSHLQRASSAAIIGFLEEPYLTSVSFD